MSEKKPCCPVCSKKNVCNNLTLRQINFTTAVYLCKDPSCPYPEGFEWIEVKRNLDDILKEDFVVEETEKSNQGMDDFDEWLNQVFDSHCGLKNETADSCISRNETSDNASNLLGQEIKDDEYTSSQINKLEVFDDSFSDITNTSNCNNNTSNLGSEIFVPKQSGNKVDVSVETTVIESKIREGKISRTSKRKVHNSRICTKIESVLNSIKKPKTKEELDLKNYLLQYISKAPSNSTPIVKPVNVVKPQVQNANLSCTVEEKRRRPVLSISNCDSLFKTPAADNLGACTSDVLTDSTNSSQNQDNCVTRTLHFGDGKFKNNKFEIITVKPQVHISKVD